MESLEQTSSHSTSSPEDSQSRPTSPEGTEERTTPDPSGTSSHESPEKLDRLGWLLKRSLASPRSGSTTLSGTWNERATPLRRSYYLLKPSDARSGKIGSSWSVPSWEVPARSPENQDGSKDLKSPRGSLLDLAYTEWLNGLPSGWISSSRDSMPSETRLYLDRRARSFERSLT